MDALSGINTMTYAQKTGASYVNTGAGEIGEADGLPSVEKAAGEILEPDGLPAMAMPIQNANNASGDASVITGVGGSVDIIA
jgi:hypothetical protein